MICNITKTPMRHLVEDLYISESSGLISSTLEPDETIYDKNYHLKYEKYEKTSLNLPIQQTRTNLVKKYLKNGSLLDFGCGNGSFLRYLNKETDIEGFGFDINPHEKALRLDRLMMKWDGVTFWDSLEHVTYPLEVIQSIRAEYVFITTPCTDDIDLKTILDWRHYRPHEHLVYFNEKSLRNLLKAAGYEALEVNYEESEIRRGGKDKNLITIVGKKIAA